MSSKFDSLFSEIQRKRDDLNSTTREFEKERDRILENATLQLKQSLGPFPDKRNDVCVLYSERRNRAFASLKGRWNNSVELFFEDDIVYMKLETTNVTLAVNTLTGVPYRTPDREIFTETLPFLSWLLVEKKISQEMINDVFSKCKNQ